MDRFRSLPMARSAVLAGRTLADTAAIGFQVILMLIVAILVTVTPLALLVLLNVFLSFFDETSHGAARLALGLFAEQLQALFDTRDLILRHFEMRVERLFQFVA